MLLLLEGVYPRLVAEPSLILHTPQSNHACLLEPVYSQGGEVAPGRGLRVILPEPLLNTL